MKHSKLKHLRLVIEIVCLLLITVSFFSVFPEAVQAIPVKTQIVPLIISLLSEGLLISVFLVIFFLLVTVIFGRLYCSFVCPLGGFQDIFIRFRSVKVGRRIKKKRYKYRKPFSRLRLLILIGVVVSTASGGLYLLSFLDPYSIFGKITTYAIKPSAVFINNSGQKILDKFGSDLISGMSFPPISFAAVIPFIIVFTVIVLMSLRHGRLYCNSVCPLGTFLGLFSNRSLYRVKIDTDACNSCGICERGCKAECIDSKKKTVDNSSCVKCFNCIKSCKGSAIHYAPAKLFHRSSKTSLEGKGISRREAVYSASGLLAFGGLNVLLGEKTKPEKSSKLPPTPPGSISVDKFMNKCTSCYLCINKCPSNVLQPSTLQFGITGAFIPYMDFSTGFCDYECRECLDVCPNDAIMPYSLEEKRRIQIGTVKFSKELCDVVKSETNCGACVEMCPTDALALIPYKKDLELPSTKVDACIGCGACQYVCPAEPQKAIVVETSLVHKELKKNGL